MDNGNNGTMRVEPGNQNRSAPPLIRASGISKIYNHSGSRIVVLNQLALTLGTGETIGIVGASGIGKSTLMLQMAAGLRRRRVLYVTGEESARQIAARARRLGRANSPLKVVAQGGLGQVPTLLGSPGGVPRGAPAPERALGGRCGGLLWARVSRRVSVQRGRVGGSSADSLYEGIQQLPWEEHLRPEGGGDDDQQ